MEVSTSKFRPAAPSLNQTPKSGDSQTFFIDPFAGVKQGFRDTVELAGEFTMGAIPGVGIQRHGGRVFSFGWGSQNRPRQIASGAGALLNATGTVALAVGVGQMALGADPSGALQLAAGTLIGSGAAAAFAEHVR